ncbi:ATP-dependent acyl-CoA ligase [Streptomyces sp. ISID311]|uniref:ATP-dependent acyl-CoA ligase n=1 Tax=Streptomyces sp. ISID311 TaxID=2601673 RepID=UPI0011BD4228|nr:ATP-dependent acyl-CoA ligase [Streptomyces sp. ISID311]TXC99900.1 AMP-binding protein [Streptomyces sp. ISID311]
MSTIPHGLPPAERTIPRLLLRQADRYGDTPLLRVDGTERSYQEMAHEVARTGSVLSAAGIGPGDRVAVMSENRVELLDVILGCAWIGAIAVPLNTALRGPALEHQLRHSGSRLLVLEANLAHALARLAPLPSLEEVWLIDGPLNGESTHPFRVLPRAGDPTPPADSEPSTTAAILFTSGTTGPAKGVVCPQAQFCWWGTNVANQLEIQPEDILYTCLPLFHVNALGAFFQALVSGATFHFGPRFSASAMLTRLIESRATVTYLLGAMVSILGNRPPSEQDRRHRVTRALAPSTTAEQQAEWKVRFGIELIDSYGSTETNAVVGAPIGQQRPGWMGPVRPGFHAQVVDAADNVVAPGVAGELIVRATEPFALANGYFNDPEKTVEAWRNLWFHTGDLVESSPDGWFRFRDRLKDSIRRRGENISSFDVEHAVKAHPAIRQVAAYALSSELGEDEVAVAVVAEHTGVTPEELISWCEGRLAYFAIPRFIRFIDDLPLTENGKVRKALLREEGTTPCWDRERAGVTISRDR